MPTGVSFLSKLLSLETERAISPDFDTAHPTQQVLKEAKGKSRRSPRHAFNSGSQGSSYSVKSLSELAIVDAYHST